jgi:hypothetical protein
MVDGALASLLVCHSKRHHPDVFDFSSRVPTWAESSLFPWRAQTAARVNDVIAGCAVQSALVPASNVCQLTPALQVLARHCSESRASRVGLKAYQRNASVTVFEEIADSSDPGAVYSATSNPTRQCRVCEPSPKKLDMDLQQTCIETSRGRQSFIMQSVSALRSSSSIQTSTESDAKRHSTSGEKHEV